MRILLTGGTGFVGRALVARLEQLPAVITVLTRHPASGSRDRLRFVEADPASPGGWQEAVPGQDVVINLAGASIFSRWTRKRKQVLRDSRLRTTQNLVQAIGAERPPVLISGSAVGYYGFHGDEELDESAQPGEDFLAALCREWEQEAGRAAGKGARVVLLRMGSVLGRGGGALRQMVKQFRLLAGGRIGTGRQWFSWIHLDDLLDAIVHLLERNDLSGAFNLTAPGPVRNRDFARALGEVLKRPAWLPAPRFAMRAVLGEFGSVLVRGQRVLPRRLLESGFGFRFPDARAALENLLATNPPG